MAGAVFILVNNTVRQVLNFLSYDHISKYDIEFVHNLGKAAISEAVTNDGWPIEMTSTIAVELSDLVCVSNSMLALLSARLAVSF